MIWFSFTAFLLERCVEAGLVTCFFMAADQLLNNPLSLFYVWQGGLSFHGGLLGVIISFLSFRKKK